jgi:hypothetical protein
LLALVAAGCGGSKNTPARYGELIRAALKRAAIEKDMREFHDWRHTGSRMRPRRACRRWRS